MKMNCEWPDMSRVLISSKMMDNALKECGGVSSPTEEFSPTEETKRNPLHHPQENFVSEDEASEEEDDDIMQWLNSDMMPATTQTALAMNQAYQEILCQCTGSINDRLGQLRTKQKIIEQTCNQLPDIKTPLKVRALLYVPPYFRDSAGMCPAANGETMFKTAANDFDMLIQPPRKWSKREEMKLVDAVNQFAFQKLLRPLLNKKEIVQEKEKKALLNDDENSEIVTKIRRDLSNIKKEIRSLKLKKKKRSLSLNDCDGIDWNQVATVKLNGSRRSVECQLAWQNAFHPKINRNKKWDDKELKKLKQLVERAGKKANYAQIATKLGTNRTAFQCHEKYQMELNENLIKQEWSDDEDKRLKEIIEQLQIGSFIPWELVVRQMEGRTRTQCQVRWGRTLNPNLKHGRWTDEEDNLLRKAVDKYGNRNWAKIADIVEGRTDAQCRERWCTVLDSSIKKESWNDKEDAILNDGIKAFGCGQWAKISGLLPGRTPAMCKIRYRSFHRKRKMGKMAKKGSNGRHSFTKNESTSVVTVVQKQDDSDSDDAPSETF